MPRRVERERERESGRGRRQVCTAVTSEGLVSDVIVPLRKARWELEMCTDYRVAMVDDTQEMENGQNAPGLSMKPN